MADSAAPAAPSPPPPPPPPDVTVRWLCGSFPLRGKDYTSRVHAFTTRTLVDWLQQVLVQDEEDAVARDWAFGEARGKEEEVVRRFFDAEYSECLDAARERLVMMQSTAKGPLTREQLLSLWNIEVRDTRVSVTETTATFAYESPAMGLYCLFMSTEAEDDEDLHDLLREWKELNNVGSDGEDEDEYDEYGKGGARSRARKAKKRQKKGAVSSSSSSSSSSSPKPKLPRQAKLYCIKDKPIEPRALFEAVKERGGFGEVDKKKYWQEVRKVLDLEFHSSTSHQIKRAYQLYEMSGRFREFASAGDVPPPPPPPPPPPAL